MARGKKRYKRKPSKHVACDGKTKYSKVDARRKAAELKRDTGGLYRAYRCHYGCKLENGARSWHVGHIYPSKF